MKEQKCSQFNIIKGIYKECQNPSEYIDTILKKYPLDFCSKHNHMMKTGIPIKCWRCGDR